jgi:hypothetical protein
MAGNKGNLVDSPPNHELDSNTCTRCKRPIVRPSGSIGTGYGENSEGEIVCYSCCGELDKEEMIKTGRATLYLNCEPAHYAKHPEGRKMAGEVTNWPGTLRFKCHTRYGKHNIAGVRYDCWFVGPDGFEWHGIKYGDNTQLVHCRRTKRKV